jgi:ribonuclease D
LQALVELREEVALDWDRPPFKVLSNQVLLGWAQDPPSGREEVLHTPRAGKGILRHLAPRILAAVRQGLKLPLRDCPKRDLTLRPRLTSEQRGRLKILKDVRRAAATRLGLSPGLLVATQTLEILVRADLQEAPDRVRSLLKRWQYQILGEALVQAMQG